MMLELDLLATPVTHSKTDVRSVHLLVVVIAFFFGSWLTVAARAYVRARMLKAVGMDDWVMFGTQIIFTLHLVFQTLDLWYGNGVHIEFLRQEDAEQALKNWYICGIFYIIGSCSLKISIGLFLLRFTTSRLQYWFLYGTNCFVAFFGSLYLVFYFLLCRPVSFWWKLSPSAAGSCLPPAVFLNTGYVAAGLNAFADCVFAILPIVIVWNTSMDRRTRILVCCLLSFGSLAAIGTLIRIPFGHTFDGYKGDFLYETIPIANLSTLEFGLGIVTGNAATLRPLVQRIWPRTFGFLTGAGKPTVEDDQEAGWKAMERVRKSAKLNKSNGVVSLTGRESISGMPDLLLVKEIKEEKALSLPTSSVGAESRTNSLVAMLKIPRVSKFTISFPLKSASRSSSATKEPMPELKEPEH